jgi:hypothetical protein
MAMKDHVAYLESVGLTPLMMKRAQDIAGMAIRTGLPDIEDVYLSDIQMDGGRRYDVLLLFGGGKVLAANEWLTSDSFVVLPAKAQIQELHLEAEHYDFQQATVQSRLSMRAYAPGNILTWDGTATQANCDVLLSLIKRHLIPAVRP